MGSKTFDSLRLEIIASDIKFQKQNILISFMIMKMIEAMRSHSSDLFYANSLFTTYLGKN